MALHVNQLSTETHEDGIDLAQFAQDVFSSLLRSDQRRWGEIYLQGLMNVPGRRSIRRICDQVVGWRADQCLQQFLNQSPWDWEPVRRRLAEHVEAVVQPRAWVIEEAVFPKYGSNSVGVERQFAYPVGRMINCQLALTVLMAGESGSSPVNWRLLLPRSWDEDAKRRKRAHVPDDVRYRSRWRQLLDAVDEMVDEWDLIPAPIVVDAHQHPQVEPLLNGLEERGVRYLVRVANGMPIATRSPSKPQTMTRLPTIDEIIMQSANRHEMTLSWPGGPDGKLIRSQFVVAHLPAAYETGSAPHDIGPGRFNRRQRRAIAQWSSSRRRPKEIWLTNLNTPQLPEVIKLITMRRRAGEEFARLSEESGLRHFEGRSYRGWHHHVTLVSVAHGYQMLSRLAAEEAVWPRASLYA